MALAENRKRARSADEKERRKAAILTAAREMVAESGFEDLTMSGLAKRAGLAKGTLYLYARSKEELLLALAVAAMGDFVTRVEAEAEAEPAGLAEDFTRIAEEVPLFLPLFARLTSVIEMNVADEPLFAGKREALAQRQRLAEILDRKLGCGEARAQEIANALLLLMLGSAQFELSTGRDPAGVPEDLRPAFEPGGFRLNFLPAARLLLSVVQPAEQVGDR